MPEESAAIPMIVTLIWYPREEWEQLRGDFVDADKYPLKWNEWRQRAETGPRDSGSAGNADDSDRAGVRRDRCALP